MADSRTSNRYELGSLRPSHSPFLNYRERMTVLTPFPEVRISTNLNHAILRSELTGIIQEVNQELFDLGSFEVEQRRIGARSTETEIRFSFTKCSTS